MCECLLLVSFIMQKDIARIDLFPAAAGHSMRTTAKRDRSAQNASNLSYSSRNEYVLQRRSPRFTSMFSETMESNSR